MTRGRRGDGDAGTSLVELLVAIIVLGLFMGALTAGVVSMSRSLQKTRAVQDAAFQLNKAFLRLDRQVRYAASLDEPGTGSGGAWYTEFQSTYNNNASTGQQATQCAQLRVDPVAKTLAERTWTEPAPAATPAWVTLATGVTPTAGVAFTFAPVVVSGVSANDSFFGRQELTVSLDATSSGAASATRALQAVFTALNSSASTPSNDGTTLVCQDYGRP